MSLKNNPQFGRQKGVGTIGILVIVSVAVFLGLFAIKLGPHYYEHWTVSKVAEELVSKPEILKRSRSQVYSYINDAYRNNNLWELKAEDTITLTRDAKRGYLVTVQYERRSKLFHNIDLVTSFDDPSNGVP